MVNLPHITKLEPLEVHIAVVLVPPSMVIVEATCGVKAWSWPASSSKARCRPPQRGSALQFSLDIELHTLLNICKQVTLYYKAIDLFVYNDQNKKTCNMRIMHSEEVKLLLKGKYK
jgi:hypothetical protein